MRYAREQYVPASSSHVQQPRLRLETPKRYVGTRPPSASVHALTVAPRASPVALHAPPAGGADPFCADLDV